MIRSFTISKNKRTSQVKLVEVMAFVIAITAMITSSTTSVFSTVEDDGWVEGEDDSQGEISSQEELEEAYEGTQWEDNIGPNEFEEATNNDEDDNNDDNGDDEQQLFTCSDGSTVTGDEECPSTGPNPYCDTEKGKAAPVCHDRKDYDQDTGLYPCNDGTNKVDWRDCKDATEKNVNNDDDDNTKTFQTTTTTSNSAEESSCRLDGSADGIQQAFDSIKYQACGLYTNGQKAYSPGFITGCTQVGNTQLICQALVDSSILNAKIQPTQTQTPTVTQPTQTTRSATVDANNCRSTGFEDGMNSGFNVNTWVNCGGADQSMYYDGFVSGCTYYDAFPVDYCKNWADGAIK